jgi:uncharacterized protein with HEPN domain
MLFMLDAIIIDNLQMIHESINIIEERFAKVTVPDKFVSNNDGVLLLDSIAMRLQVIGELTKKIHKINSTLLDDYTEVEWNKIIKLREIISHHYEMVDHEIIFDICKNHMPLLKTTIKKMLNQNS